MEQNIEMLEEMVLIEPILEEKSEKGILLPPSSRDGSLIKGKVIAVNSKKGIQLNDIVVYSQIGSMVYRYNNKDLQIVNERQIFAKLK